MKKLTVLIILAMLISMVAAAAVYADEAWKAGSHLTCSRISFR